MLLHEDTTPAMGDYRLQRQRSPLEIGPYTLSVQASRTHCCNPREDGHHLQDYFTVEIALMKDDTPGFIRPDAVGMPDLCAYWEDTGDHPVGGYVPMEDAERLAQHLKTISEKGTL